MSEKLGIESLKAELALVASVVKIYGEAKADNHLGVEDLGLLLKLVGPAEDAVKAVSGVIPEFKDLSAEEVAELGGVLASDLVAGDARIAAIVEESVKTLAQVYKLIEVIKAPAA